jgi:hypothetical protein
MGQVASFVCAIPCNIGQGIQAAANSTGTAINTVSTGTANAANGLAHALHIPNSGHVTAPTVTVPDIAGPINTACHDCEVGVTVAIVVVCVVIVAVAAFLIWRYCCCCVRNASRDNKLQMEKLTAAITAGVVGALAGSAATGVATGIQPNPSKNIEKQSLIPRSQTAKQHQFNEIARKLPNGEHLIRLNQLANKNT